MADQFFGAFAAQGRRRGPGGGRRRGQRRERGRSPMSSSDPEVTAEAVEERPRSRPAAAVLGGPYMWGLLALIVVIVLILIFR